MEQKEFPQYSFPQYFLKNQLRSEASSSNCIQRKPYIPYRGHLVETHQNLTEGTFYNIGIIEPDVKSATMTTIDEKLSLIGKTLNNETEILSLIAGTQIPNIITKLDELEQKIKQISNKEKSIVIPKKILPPFSWR